MNAVTIAGSGPVHATIRPPGPKSITNRALICAALPEGRSLLGGALDSGDTRERVESLRQLGVDGEVDLEAARIAVAGHGGRLPVVQAHLFVANRGTTVRFLTAMLASATGHYRLDGIARMRERP